MALGRLIPAHDYDGDDALAADDEDDAYTDDTEDAHIIRNNAMLYNSI